MATPPEDATARTLERQRAWYGEPLGDLCRHLIGELGLNQARLAAVLGLSAPMLSQLMSGQRAKIGNPAVVQRLQALQELAAQTADGSASPAEAAARMEEIRQSAGSALLSTTSSRGTGQAQAGSGPQRLPGSRRVVREIQALLRSVCSADEILAAAGVLAADHPELAEFLRVYGAGRTDEAARHYEAHQD